MAGGRRRILVIEDDRETAEQLSCILAVPVCCGLSMADESSSYIEVGPFSNSRRMGRGASLTVGVFMQRTPPCLGDSI
jgi:hypothetical protein